MSKDDPYLNRCDAHMCVSLSLNDEPDTPKVTVIKKVSDPGEAIAAMGEIMSRERGEAQMSVSCSLPLGHNSPHIFNVGVQFIGKGKDGSGA